MKISKLIATFFVASAALIAVAQNGINTPYSRLGYGILSDNVTSAQRGMGGVGYAMNSKPTNQRHEPGIICSHRHLDFSF